jgi:UDP-galactopyranose mutase
MEYDYLIVGAGLSGCVFAERISSQLNKNVLIVDTRDHIGGNCYDFHNDDGILVHKYGPHWFHTNDKNIFDYLSQFTTWRHHDHKVRSFIAGQLLPFPINRDTINQLYNLDLKTSQDVEEFYNSVRVKEITIPRNSEEVIISQVGWDLYDKFYRNYTIKQWALNPTHLEASITSRIPIRTNDDDRYFCDLYQGVPEDGYTALFKRMMASKNIRVVLQTDYKKIMKSVTFKKMIFTGSIDYYFDYKFGILPYRSLRFEHQTLDMEYYQPYQQINYPNDYDYTRIVEWKHATGQKHPKTTITKEYPCQQDASNEKLYPIITRENLDKLKKYKAEAAKIKNVIFCGRLAEYRYYNMDQVVGRVLSIFEREFKPEPV